MEKLESRRFQKFFFFGILMPQTGGGFYQWMNVSKLNKTCEGHAVAALWQARWSRLGGHKTKCQVPLFRSGLKDGWRQHVVRFCKLMIFFFRRVHVISFGNFRLCIAFVWFYFWKFAETIQFIFFWKISIFMSGCFPFFRSSLVMSSCLTILYAYEPGSTCEAQKNRFPLSQTTSKVMNMYTSITSAWPMPYASSLRQMLCCQVLWCSGKALLPQHLQVYQGFVVLVLKDGWFFSFKITGALNYRGMRSPKLLFWGFAFNSGITLIHNYSYKLWTLKRLWKLPRF